VITQAGLADTWAEEHKNALVAGFASGYSEFIFIAVDALLFYVGALMVDAGTVDFKVCNFLVHSEWKQLRVVMLGFGTGRCLNEGPIPNTRVERVALGTGYTRVEGNRRASRNGRVSNPPPEIHCDSQPFHRCTLVISLPSEPQREGQRWH
jgi:hypothetical protein